MIFFFLDKENSNNSQRAVVMYVNLQDSNFICLPLIFETEPCFLGPSQLETP